MRKFLFIILFMLVASSAFGAQVFTKWRRNPVKMRPTSGSTSDGGSGSIGPTSFTPTAGTAMDPRTNPILGSPTNLCITVDLTPPILVWPLGTVGLVSIGSGPGSVELFVEAGILRFRVIDSAGLSKTISSLSVLALGRDKFTACAQNGTLSLTRSGLVVLSGTSGTGSGQVGPLSSNLYLKYANGSTLTSGTLHSVCITDMPGTCP